MALTVCRTWRRCTRLPDRATPASPFFGWPSSRELLAFVLAFAHSYGYQPVGLRRWRGKVRQAANVMELAACTPNHHPRARKGVDHARRCRCRGRVDRHVQGAGKSQVRWRELHRIPSVPIGPAVSLDLPQHCLAASVDTTNRGVWPLGDEVASFLARYGDPWLRAGRRFDTAHRGSAAMPKPRCGHRGRTHSPWGCCRSRRCQVASRYRATRAPEPAACRLHRHCLLRKGWHFRHLVRGRLRDPARESQWDQSSPSSILQRRTSGNVRKRTSR